MFNKIISVLFTATFLLITFVMGIGTLLAPDRKISEAENRTLQTFPIFSPTSLLTGQFFKQLNAYTSDQLIGRDEFVKTYEEQQLLTVNRATVVNDIVVVDQQWLLQKPADRLYKTPMDKALEGIQKMKGIVAPHRTEIHYVSLPFPILTLRHLYPSYLQFREPMQNKDYFLTELRKDKTIKVIDVAEPFAAIPEKQRETMYFYTDHHWNMNGAFLGYQSIIREVSNTSAIFRDAPLTENEMNKQQLSKGPFIGSWNRQLNNLIDASADRPWVYKPKGGFTFDQIQVWTTEGKVYDRLENIYGAGIKYPPYQYSSIYAYDHPKMELVNKKASNRLHVLIFKDSYTNTIFPFIAQHFYKTTIIDLRYYKENLEQYLQDHPYNMILMLYNDSNFTTPTYPFLK